MLPSGGFRPTDPFTHDISSRISSDDAPATIYRASITFHNSYGQHPFNRRMPINAADTLRTGTDAAPRHPVSLGSLKYTSHPSHPRMTPLNGMLPAGMVALTCKKRMTSSKSQSTRSVTAELPAQNRATSRYPRESIDYRPDAMRPGSKTQHAVQTPCQMRFACTAARGGTTMAAPLILQPIGPRHQKRPAPRSRSPGRRWG